MNRRLARILRANTTLTSLCLVAFVAAAIPVDIRLAVAEAIVAALVILLNLRRSRSTQQSMRQYVERINGGMDSARSSNMLYAPLPMMVFNVNTDEVVWGNDGFLQLTSQKDGVFELKVEEVIPGFGKHWLLEGKRESPELVTWDHRTYRVFGSLTHPEETGRGDEMLATTYWMDVTDSEQMRSTLELTRPVVAILMVDNYEELMKACPENRRSAVVAALEEKLNAWAAGSGGLVLGYDRDRYLFLFEEKSYPEFVEHRFSVLDTVREVVAGEGVAATLSIGVGRDADDFDGLFKNATLALEMALSRGGDQAVVKDRW